MILFNIKKFLILSLIILSSYFTAFGIKKHAGSIFRTGKQSLLKTKLLSHKYFSLSPLFKRNKHQIAHFYIGSQETKFSTSKDEYISYTTSGDRPGTIKKGLIRSIYQKYPHIFANYSTAYRLSSDRECNTFKQEEWNLYDTHQGLIYFTPKNCSDSLQNNQFKSIASLDDIKNKVDTIEWTNSIDTLLNKIDEWSFLFSGHGMKEFEDNSFDHTYALYNAMSDIFTKQSSGYSFKKGGNGPNKDIRLESNVAGLATSTFAKIMATLNNGIQTRLLAISSCFCSAKRLLSAVQKYEKVKTLNYSVLSHHRSDIAIIALDILGYSRFLEQETKNAITFSDTANFLFENVTLIPKNNTPILDMPMLLQKIHTINDPLLIQKYISTFTEKAHLVDTPSLTRKFMSGVSGENLLIPNDLKPGLIHAGSTEYAKV